MLGAYLGQLLEDVELELRNLGNGLNHKINGRKVF
jgi:hypothetical protein